LSKKIPTDEPTPDEGREEPPVIAAGLESEFTPASCSLLICPRCHRGFMDYNGLLELTCPVCGYKEPGGAFT